MSVVFENPINGVRYGEKFPVNFAITECFWIPLSTFNNIFSLENCKKIDEIQLQWTELDQNRQRKGYIN